MGIKEEVKNFTFTTPNGDWICKCRYYNKKKLKRCEFCGDIKKEHEEEDSHTP
jgi:hypothetical protein